MATVSDLSRPEMLDVAKALLHRLEQRRKQGPAEDALDAYIPELEESVKALSTHVGGQAKADARRRAALAALDSADAEVDTWLRHVESFVSIEARRRNGIHSVAAQATYQAAFPNGLAHVDDYIPDENRMCRAAIAVLEEPAHAATMKAIGLPDKWTKKWRSAIDKSDACFAAVESARASRTAHVDGGLDAEAELVDLTVRLRRYVSSRAKRTDKAKLAEGQELLAPLLDAIAKAQAARAARRKTAKADAASP